ncbi:MAG TPA: thiol reductant ABC exporter subunit CydD [Glaciibacter sp.]|nr:thiol reductant ABC exporter subunit CydD [Glaciibacter sp.]
MRPFDPRLLRYASSTRGYLVVGAMLGFTQTLVVIAFAWLLSHSIVGALDGRPVAELATTIGALAAVIVVRATLVWLVDVVAHRGAARVKSQLRARVLDRVAALGPDWLAGRQGARVTTVITTGLDALDNYFARYLPQLLLSAVATPILIVVIALQDLPSGITVIIVLPLIPVFMVLIGLATRAVQREQWEALQRLSAGFLELVGGLGTLKIYGREHRQASRLRSITEGYRTRTMTVLRVSFLSGFVLELAASLSVAIVAVSIGLRLVDGSLGLAVGLFVLLLAPEAFLPIRNVGTQFHAAADGLAAAEEVFAILEDTADSRLSGGAIAVDADSARDADARDAGTLRFDGVTVRRDGSPVVDRFDAEFHAGEVSVIAGPSGAGKSTLLAALLGFVAFEGEITVGGRPVPSGELPTWLAWAGQRPGLFGGTIAANVALGEVHVDRDLVLRSLRWAGATDLDPGTVLGVNGEGLSGGQAQRVATARAMYRSFVRGCQVVVLDEPSSALDASAEADLIEGLRRLAAEGRVVIVVSHRPALVEASDQVVHLGEVARV